MDIDLIDPARFAAGHPHAQYDWLRANAPVYWHAEPNGPGFWAVTGYDAVYEVDRDFQTYSSQPTVMLDDPPPGPPPFGDYQMMLMMDPPQHTAFRRLIREEFLPDPTMARVPRMQRLARQIVDKAIAKGRCDFVSEIAGEMPSYVIAELMGLPLEDGRELYKLTEIIHTSPSAQAEGAGAQAVFKMFEYGMGIIAEKRARPADDLATKLLNAEVEGRKLADMEFLLFFLLLVDAGGDIIARRIEYFATVDAMESAISGLIAHLRSYYSGEGLYVIEHILLLPEEAGDPFMDICVDTACTDCAAADPYTYRVTVVLPAFTGRFRDMDFRRFVEETLRQEMPAHILPRICWVNSDDMAAIEKAYRDWLAIRSGAATAGRADKIAALNRALTRAKNVYPSSGLHPCGQLEPPPFMLGRTALGSAGEPLDS